MRSSLGLHDRPEIGPSLRSPAAILATEVLGRGRGREPLEGESGCGGRAARETWPAQLGARLGVLPVP